jgi:hypothetical protein
VLSAQCSVLRTIKCLNLIVNLLLEFPYAAHCYFAMASHAYFNPNSA